MAAVSPDTIGLTTGTGLKRTVLIFAYECAPFNKPESTVGAQRPAQFAKYLPDFGWRAIVLCCDATKRDNGWLPGDLEALAGVLQDVDREDSRVVATPSMPSDGGLDRAWRATRSARSPGAALLRKSLTFARFFTGDYSRSWQPCAREAAQLIALRTPIHACIGEHSPDAGLFLARWFSKTYHVPWIADFRDPMLFGFPPRVRPLLEPFARRMLRSASHIVNVTPFSVRLDEELFDPPITLITNGFDPDQFAGASPPRSTTEFRIAYTGNLWLPDSLRLFCDGLAEFRERIGIQRFKDVRFVYRGVARARVESIARDAGVYDVLDGGEHIDHRASLSLIRGAHVLLVLSTSEVQHRDPYWAKGVYPGKTFEYLGARRPILCVPGDGASLDQLLRDARAGTSQGSAPRIAEYLESMYRTWESERDIPLCDNEELVARFSRRVGAGQLARVLDGVVGEASRNTNRRRPFAQRSRGS
jgi:hypothetical protein